MNDDLTALTDKLKELLGTTDIGSLSGAGEHKAEDNSTDIETILKLKKAYDTINSKPDKRTALLASLKPYMNERRSAELDKISGLLSLTKVTELVKVFKGGI